MSATEGIIIRHPRLLIVIAIASFLALAIPLAANAELQPKNKTTYQGKDVNWWAKRAVQARKDANARAVTIRQLHRTLRHSASIDEAVKLATTIYPSFSEARAWRIIGHESCRNCKNLGYIPLARTHAKNPRSTATGLMQFLISTYMSTPFGQAGFSIYSPYAQLLAAGWMHEVGRGCEWQISPLPSNCR